MNVLCAHIPVAELAKPGGEVGGGGGAMHAVLDTDKRCVCYRYPSAGGSLRAGGERLVKIRTGEGLGFLWEEEKCLWFS